MGLDRSGCRAGCAGVRGVWLTGVSPEQARAWIRVVRDGMLVVAGTVIVLVVLLLYITRDEPPNLTLVGLATMFYGLGAALRADEWLTKRNGNGGSERGS